MTRTFRFVPHDLVEEYLAQGWALAGPLRGHHGVYCVLMEQGKPYGR